MTKYLLAAILATAALADAVAAPPPAAAPARAGIEAFNRALIDATTRMDNAATLSLWEEDGIALLPLTKPSVGRKAIAAFLDETMAQLSSARMEKFEMSCHDIEVSGDWASEWCVEHQRVQMGGDKPAFEGSGVILLVLHRGTDGKWRMKREMWNQAAPAAPGDSAK